MWINEFSSRLAKRKIGERARKKGFSRTHTYWSAVVRHVSHLTTTATIVRETPRVNTAWHRWRETIEFQFRICPSTSHSLHVQTNELSFHYCDNGVALWCICRPDRDSLACREAPREHPASLVLSNSPVFPPVPNLSFIASDFRYEHTHRCDSISRVCVEKTIFQRYINLIETLSLALNAIIYNGGHNAKHDNQLGLRNQIQSREPSLRCGLSI